MFCSVVPDVSAATICRSLFGIFLFVSPKVGKGTCHLYLIGAFFSGSESLLCEAQENGWKLNLDVYLCDFFTTDRGPSGDKNRPSCEKSKRHLDGGNCKGNEDGFKPLASSSQNPLTSTSYEGQEQAAIEMCRARYKGRVGTYIREGNVSLASFGIKVKRDKKGQKVDLTKSLSQLLPYVVLATAVSALAQPASFAW